MPAYACRDRSIFPVHGFFLGGIGRLHIPRATTTHNHARTKQARPSRHVERDHDSNVQARTRRSIRRDVTHANTVPESKPLLHWVPTGLHISLRFSRVVTQFSSHFELDFAS